MRMVLRCLPLSFNVLNKGLTVGFLYETCYSKGLMPCLPMLADMLTLALLLTREQFQIYQIHVSSRDIFVSSASFSPSEIKL